MKSALLLFMLLLVPAWTQAAGVDLAWNACAPDGGVSDVTFDCANPSAEHRFFGTFTTDTEIQDLSLVELSFRYQVDAAVLPGFWSLFHPVGNPTGCNAAYVIAGTSMCPTNTPWPIFGCNIEPWTEEVIPLSNGGRIKVTGANFGCSPVHVQAGTPYLIHHVALYTALAGSCSGCSVPGVIVFEELTLHERDSEVPPSTITAPGAFSNCITFNGGGGVPCSATPARRNTWGALKSLYR